MKGALLWFIGIPLPFIILLVLFWHRVSKKADRHLTAAQRHMSSERHEGNGRSVPSGVSYFVRNAAHGNSGLCTRIQAVSLC
jgi:hypothetical protein